MKKRVSLHDVQMDNFGIWRVSWKKGSPYMMYKWTILGILAGIMKKRVSLLDIQMDNFGFFGE